MSAKFIVAVSCILWDDGKVLVAKRLPRKDLPIDIWEFPSGRLEENEEPLEGLKREMREELGIEVQPLFIVDAYKILRKGIPTIILCYLCSSDQKEVKLTEHSESRWVDLPEALDLFEFDDQKNVVKKLQNFKPLLPLYLSKLVKTK